MSKSIVIGLSILLFACSNEEKGEAHSATVKEIVQEDFSKEEIAAIQETVQMVYAAKGGFRTLAFRDFASKELDLMLLNVLTIETRNQLTSKPSEKPDMIEGEIFASLHEGVSDFEIMNLKKVDERCVATVQFIFAFDESSPVETWQDELLLVYESGKWKLDNVVYEEGRGYPKDLKTLIQNYTDH